MTQNPSHQVHDTDETRNLLDQLLQDSRLYYRSKDYKELLDFVVQLRNFAPFNAMLLNFQKPGLSYAASKHDWWEKFKRYPNEDARPLLILWPFGPVALVYDVQDTEGQELPEDAFSFVAKGDMSSETFRVYTDKCKSKGIICKMVDKGGNMAGLIRAVKRAVKKEDKPEYEIKINQNHALPVKFNTLVHELAHLYLGHLGKDICLKTPDRHNVAFLQRELEAESVAYLVCFRSGVKPKSHTYLAGYVRNNQSIDNIDIYQIMRTAGQVETLLGLTLGRTGFSG
ncbi:hypothetical protein [Desulfonatronovibrio magnus]|uniref:hypothetical protein n=1 Tax=Desulfonatronovibrio magnus TaxID=698827 RepID=UPI0005EB6113|nr:hypothetical protein [Desulfonatronovibrio magnus]